MRGVLKLSCFLLQILSPLKRLTKRQYGKNKDFVWRWADFDLEKRNFPEKTLSYVNHGYISTVKGSELAIYIDVFLLEQVTTAANQRNEVETYECQKNETKWIKCLYDQAIGDFLGLRNDLAYIVLRGDDNECFFSYGYNEKKSKVLYSATKDRIPNAVITTSVQKYFHEVLNERWHND